ncbi:MAG: GIY-YIG nuclease family protein [Crocinitomicaceae bacterium]|nr:GIY-YIG nuclease family protein [Crocinitomicaceae bacterium]
MKFFTYILCSLKTGKYYVGHSQDLDLRIVKHNAGEVKSTRSGRPWKIVYFEVFETRSESFKREKEIKNKKSRKYITALINKRE